MELTKIKVDSPRSRSNAESSDSELNASRNVALESNQANENLDVEDKKQPVFCHCEPNDPKYNSNKKSCKKCNTCGKTKYVDPWWVINDVEDVTGVREKMLQFIKYHNPTKTFSCEKPTADHKFEPGPTDRFGIVNSVKCVTCKVEMSLEMNTANRRKRIVIEKDDVLKPGDEIEFRRCYGISHHAIFLRKKNTTNDECCSSCREFCRISDDTIEVVSHTLDEKDARIIKSDESLQGYVDVYRVEYDHCYPPEYTEMIAMRAAQVAEYKKLFETSDSNYDPFLDNCEHFARRCKTGQSESIQVKDCLHNCWFHIAMFFLRVAILATSWIAEATIEDNEFKETATVGLPQTTQYDLPAISFVEIQSFDEAMIKDNEFMETTTVDGVLPDPKYILSGKDLARMELILSTSLCTLFTLLKVGFSSFYECRKLRRRQDTIQNAKSDENSSAMAIGRCGTCCSECCCNCCPCPVFRYLCIMLFCRMPIRLCKQICCTGYCNGCCDGPVVRFRCSQYVVIVLRVLVSEVLIIGIPIAFFATFEWYCNFEAFTRNSVIRAAYGFLFTFPLVLILSTIHSCISYALGRSIGWFCRRCCCCCCRPKSDNGGSSDA